MGILLRNARGRDVKKMGFRRTVPLRKKKPTDPEAWVRAARDEVSLPRMENSPHNDDQIVP
jgi:hypothetical protein